MPVHTVKTFWKDANGDTATSSFNVTTTNQTLVTDLITEMQALSDLECIGYDFTKNLGEPSGASGPEVMGAGHPYADDKAALVLEFAAGSSRKVKPRVSVPGPAFILDGDVAYSNDLALLSDNSVAATAITALTDIIKTAGGNAVTVLRNGYIDIRRGKRAAR